MLARSHVPAKCSVVARMSEAKSGAFPHVASLIRAGVRLALEKAKCYNVTQAGLIHADASAAHPPPSRPRTSAGTDRAVDPAGLGVPTPAGKRRRHCAHLGGRDLGHAWSVTNERAAVPQSDAWL